MTDLYTIRDGRQVGVFHEIQRGVVVFEYDPAWRGAPISLSLPIGASAAPGAAWAFLDNLLPDREEVRERWRRDRSLPDTDPVTLLAAYGEDVAGALTLTDNAELLEQPFEAAPRATDDDIAERVARLAREVTSWHDPRTHQRMSLAGAQGKFTLVADSGAWFWPTYHTPSTHILKPAALDLRNLDIFEHLGLELAHAIGMRASHSEIMTFLGQRTFATERWDREPAAGLYGARRLHAEDLNQALGRPTEQKYQVSAVQIARLLDKYGLAYQFTAQLAFNAALGNTDAHAKNYSLLLDNPQPELSPLYDIVPVLLYPQYDSVLAMPIGGAREPAELTEVAWRRFAASAGLDIDRVVTTALPVMRAVADHYLDVFGPSSDSTRLHLINKRVRILQRITPSDPGPIPLSTPDAQPRQLDH